jgi:NADH-quinone oxidoreductase subunit C
MPAAEVIDALRTRFGAEAYALGAQLPCESLLEAMRALRDTHGYRYYITGCAVDRDDVFEVVHGLRNIDSGDELFVKVLVPKDRPVVDSAAFVFAGAEWHEREILDLFGVEFRSHPDPRRILMPDDYEGHPLRKDFAMDTPWGYRPPTADEGKKR